MTDMRTREAIRYLGYGKHAVDERTLALISDSFRELESCARAKSIYRIFGCSRESECEITIGTMHIKSRSLARNLEDCRAAALLGATLGAEVDLRMNRDALTDMARAVVWQACAAAYLEEYCDRVQAQIKREAAEDGKLLRPRFSPGYGDFDISHQEELLRMLDAQKTIGLTLTDSRMLAPTKSVTAVIGISDTGENCPETGCEACGKKDCRYRRDEGKKTKGAEA